MAVTPRPGENAFNLLQEQYEELSNKMEAFAHQWFGSASDNYEVNMIIGLPDQINMEVGLSYDILMGTKTNSFLPNANPGILNSSKYCRLRYALLHNHVSVCVMCLFYHLQHSFNIGLNFIVKRV